MASTSTYSTGSAAFFYDVARVLPFRWRYLWTMTRRMAEVRKRARMPKTITKGRM